MSDLIPGVGYTPISTFVFWVKPGGGQIATTTFNRNAPNPFEGREVNIPDFRARYGARNTRSGRWELEDGTICLFPVDAESIGILMRAMELAAKTGGFPEFTGTPLTHTLIPTLLEAHDYAATHSDGGRSLMSAMGVGGGISNSNSGTGGIAGQPRITKLSSPSPGKISLTWITGPAEAFEIKVSRLLDIDRYWRVLDSKSGNTRTHTLTLPQPNNYGTFSVSVRGSIGGIFGKWSQVKTVTVEKPSEEEPPISPISPILSIDALSLEQLDALSGRLWRGEETPEDRDMLAVWLENRAKEIREDRKEAEK